MVRPHSARIGIVIPVLAIGLTTLSGVPPAVGAPVPGTTCRVLPRNNIWNTRVDALPVNPNSDTWLATMNASTTNLHPDFGGPPYGYPFAVVDNSHPTVSVDFHYAGESDPGPYPFGPDIPIEPASDRHAFMINSDTCVLYELYAADWNGGNPKAGSGAIFDLGSNRLRPDTWTSADAAGLAIFPGLVRYDEVQAGHINHAIRFTADLTDASHLWPARHDAGTPNPAYPPMGARFRMKAGYDISGFSRPVRVILTAMKQYGLILADNGSNWFFQGTTDSGWTDGILDQLKAVPASAFEAIDESACQVRANSGKAACP
jgi:hypothetical protein